MYLEKGKSGYGAFFKETELMPVFSHEKTREAAVASQMRGVSFYLECLRKDNLPLPPPVTDVSLREFVSA